jgi:hypothetical protein
MVLVRKSVCEQSFQRPNLNLHVDIKEIVLLGPLTDFCVYGNETSVCDESFFFNSHSGEGWN